jgi:hypothetical protein
MIRSADQANREKNMVEKVAPVRRDFDRMDQIPEMVFRVLQMFNFLIILYITLISSHALWGYVH